MIDPEVTRLRRLRDVALRSRAVARALTAARAPEDDPLLARAACACWRIVRAASGRLMGHPYPRYQRGPSLFSLVRHALRGRLVALTHRSRPAGLHAGRDELLELGRLLSDVRALTLTPQLSDTLGRSQWEIDMLLFTLGQELARGATEVRPAPRPIELPRPIERAPAELPAAIGGDWPYLAL